jgi:hypothetical protein
MNKLGMSDGNSDHLCGWSRDGGGKGMGMDRVTERGMRGRVAMMEQE